MTLDLARKLCMQIFRAAGLVAFFAGANFALIACDSPREEAIEDQAEQLEEIGEEVGGEAGEAMEERAEEMEDAVD